MAVSDYDGWTAGVILSRSIEKRRGIVLSDALPQKRLILLLLVERRRVLCREASWTNNGCKWRGLVSSYCTNKERTRQHIKNGHLRLWWMDCRRHSFAIDWEASRHSRLGLDPGNRLCHFLSVLRTRDRTKKNIIFLSHFEFSIPHLAVGLE